MSVSLSISLETFRFKDENDYTSSRFDLKFFLVFSKYRLPGKLHFTIFHWKKLGLLSLVKVTPSSDRKMIKLLTFDNLFASL